MKNELETRLNRLLTILILPTTRTDGNCTRDKPGEVDAMVQQRNILRASDCYYRKNDGKGEFGTTYTK